MTLPRAGGVVERGHDAESGQRGGKDVADPRADLHRGCGVRTRDAHRAPHGLSHHIVGRAVDIGAHSSPWVAETADGGINQARVVVREHLVSDSEPVHDAGAEILHHDIRILDQTPEERLAFGRFQVDRDALLVAVRALEIAAEVADSIVFEKWTEMPRGIAFDGLDLDHAGSLICQEHGAVRPGQHLRQVDHLYPGQGT